MFGDGAQDKFCASSFLFALIFVSQKTKNTLVFRKVGIAQTKVLSILNMKLQAALMASRLMKNLIRALSFTVALTFIGSENATFLRLFRFIYKLPTFVANWVC